MTIAQELANLPDAPFEVFEYYFTETGPMLIRGTCISKEKSRCHIEWPSGSIEKLKPAELSLNRQDALSSAAKEVLRWGARTFLGPGLHGAQERIDNHETIVGLIRLAAAHRIRTRREARAQAEMDELLYGIKPAEE